MRRALPLLLAGWLLGVLTAFVVPDLTVERRTYVLDRRLSEEERARNIASAGWVVTRSDQAFDLLIMTVERPRLRLP